MYVARILYPVEVLGPGKRVGIWFCGCSKRCKGCSNPELWEFNDRYRTSPQAVFSLVKMITDSYPVDGFTITGGDPMFQPDSLKILLKMLCKINSDILVYTGFKIDEINESYLDNISVLIDGEYVEDQNDGCVLRGSRNQKIHILDDNVHNKYESYFENATNKIQNFSTSDGIVSVGIHKPNFINEFNSNVSKKGLIIDE